MKKKTILTLVSIGVLILVVFVATNLLYNPRFKVSFNESKASDGDWGGDYMVADGDPGGSSGEIDPNACIDNPWNDPLCKDKKIGDVCRIDRGVLGAGARLANYSEERTRTYTCSPGFIGGVERIVTFITFAGNSVGTCYCKSNSGILWD